ncbi:hypothetical protein K443DRAFT_10957 [Laccaria amethystina LaAM-08-1]|uniref:Uncharacterized protein n=1 Tax=Laccaria amethystina LaAM-08-1 TaxID=1095629 RepID=A0A0C9XIN2_9AGAR|nr:hypothetical protein K443DRAFT_10957 [Laccaria amethystina LaAM-08-1]
MLLIYYTISRQDDAPNVVNYEEYKDLVKNTILSALGGKPVVVFVEMLSIEKSAKRVKAGNNDGGLSSDDEGAACDRDDDDNPGLSKEEYDLAKERTKLEKRYQNDHNGSYTYIDATSVSISLTPFMMKEWACALVDKDKNVNINNPPHTQTFNPANRRRHQQQQTLVFLYHHPRPQHPPNVPASAPSPTAATTHDRHPPPPTTTERPRHTPTLQKQDQTATSPHKNDATTPGHAGNEQRPGAMSMLAMRQSDERRTMNVVVRRRWLLGATLGHYIHRHEQLPQPTPLTTHPRLRYTAGTPRHPERAPATSTRWSARCHVAVSDVATKRRMMMISSFVVIILSQCNNLHGGTTTTTTERPPPRTTMSEPPPP